MSNTPKERGVWCIEGEWSGPRSPAGDYIRTCYREYTSRCARADEVSGLGHIGFSDGTTLRLSVRKLDKGDRKRLPSMLSYSGLIADCLAHGVRSVDALCEAQKRKDVVK